MAFVGSWKGALCALGGSLFLLSPAQAECGIERGSVRILSNDIEALRIVSEAAAECASDSVSVARNHTSEHKNIQVPALSVSPAEYTVAMIANNSIVPLMNADLIRPLDDLVERYGQDLSPNQLVRMNGRVVAIAVMSNAQHLVFRRDVLEEAGLDAPGTWPEILAAAETIREKGIMENPLAAPNGAGWNLANEFVNMYLGAGGEFFAPGSAEPAIANAAGERALDTMMALTRYMDREHLSFDAGEVKALYDGGRVAIMNQWGSLAGAILENPAREIGGNTAVAAAPALEEGGVPAAALWWDGFAIARNASDEDAEASFRALMHGLRPEVVNRHPDTANWLVAGAETGPAMQGVTRTGQAKARAYPSAPAMELMHTALGTELVPFMQGRESAADALRRTEGAYRVMAREAGFL